MRHGAPLRRGRAGRGRPASANRDALAIRMRTNDQGRLESNAGRRVARGAGPPPRRARWRCSSRSHRRGRPRPRRRAWWRRMRLMRGRGRRSRMRRGTATTGTVANATWAAAGKYGKALSFNGTSARVTIPDAGLAAPDHRDDAGGVGQPGHRQRRLARRDLQGQRQLLPRWRPPTNSGRPGGGAIAGGSYGERLRHRQRSPTNTWTLPGRDLRRRRRCASTSTAPRSRPPPRPARSPPPPTRSRSAATPSTASTSPA